MRRMLIGLVGICMLGSLLVAEPGVAADRAVLTPPGAIDGDYADRVYDALRRTDDHWGEKLMKAPDGPTFDSLESVLLPAFRQDERLTDSGWVYLPQTYPIPEPNQWVPNRQPFSLHVLDGSQLVANWVLRDEMVQPRPPNTTFLVGGSSEIYGSREGALATPELAGGHLPILVNRYTDTAGVRWDRESFVTRINGHLVSWVKFTAYGAGSTSLRVRMFGQGVEGATQSGNQLVGSGNTFLAWNAPGASWAQPTLTIPVNAQASGTSVYLMVPNTAAPLGGTAVDAGAYDAAKAGITAYWNNQLAGGAQVEIPEEYAARAMRNLLIQNLVMGWQQSIGNHYESRDGTWAFVPEVAASVQVLGEFGHAAAWRKHLQEIMRRGQPGFFPAWENGIKLQSAASYYFLTGDRTFLVDNLATFNNYLNAFINERNGDPNGLVAKGNYGTDIWQKVYGVHHQTEAWRGMRDLGYALNAAAMASDGQRFLSEARDFEGSLRAAITASQRWLPDGSLYVPISLLDPDAPEPYEMIPATKLGSYWNLTIGYFAATGFFPPGSPEAKGLAKYLYQHGGLLLGLTRFNLTGIDPGVCWAGSDHFGGNAPGYKASGVDEQYGYSRIKFLSDNQEIDRLTLNFYGKLAHDLTPKTFIGGEGATVSPCPELNEYYRTQFFPPLSANNATYLEALRAVLVRESLNASGVPDELWLTPATPRPWLADGKRIAVTGLPTKFGKVSYQVQSRLSQGYIEATVTPPPRLSSRLPANSVKLTLRAPVGYRLSSVTVDGAAHPFTGETIDLGARITTATVRANYQPVAVPRSDQAEVTLTAPQRAIFQPGQRVTFTATVEALGAGSVPGSLSLAVPAGWTAPAAKPFTVTSGGKLAWGKVPIELTVPAGAAEGEYTVGFVATPSTGTTTTTPVKVRVARPVAESYRDLVMGDGPTAYWRLGETTGTFPDTTQYGTTATARDSVQMGQPGAIAGDGNGSVRLSGGYVDTPHTLAVTPSGPSAFEAWVKVTQAYQQGILEKYSPPAKNGFALRLENFNRIRLALIGPNGDVSNIEGTRTLLPGEWHHIVVAYDRSMMDIYVDGKIEFRAPAGGMPTVGVSPLRIGARGDDAAFRLNGWLDEVAMYPHPLTVTQVEEHFLKGVLGHRS